MSNKNLKVYQIEFITELKKLYFNVKFPCQIKVTWKRSNQTAESTLVPLQNGVVNFNQTLRLSVNMYFDTTTNKFVEKKCAYSFSISTEKGQKSAGHVHIDLAEFFNKRIYQMDQSFVLEKCPVAGTKIEMKIHYEEDTKQKGYDSMSCISATNPLDSSVASVDLNELSGKSQVFASGKSGISASRSDISDKLSQNQTAKSSKSEKDLSESEVGTRKEEVFDKLDVSDIIESSPSAKDNLKSDGTKIGENIKNINSLTSKINDFVNNKSKNIRFQVEGLKRRISQLQEQSQSQRFARQKIQKQLQQQRKKYSLLNRQYSDYKTDSQHKFEAQKRRSAEIQGKSLQNQRLISQLEARMNQSGESQSAYIDQLKQNARASAQKLSLQITELKETLLQQKKIRNEQNARIQELQAQARDLKVRYNSEAQKNNSLEDNMRKKQLQIEQTRINLEKAFQNLVNSLNSLL